jgi:hypothetical protein
MNLSQGSKPLPGNVRQYGYVVPNIDRAMAAWVGLGVGPWYVIRKQTQSGLYRGEPCEVTLSIAFANSGDLQIELIQQADDTPSIYTEFLAAGGADVHQLAWWTDDFEASLKAVEATGWPVVWSGGGEGGSTRYAYLELPAGAPAAVVELMELTPAIVGLGRLVREAAKDWDGTDPIRPLG